KSRSVTPGAASTKAMPASPSSVWMVDPGPAEIGARAVPLTATHSTASPPTPSLDRKSTRLNSSHVSISYAVFCLKKKNKTQTKKPCGDRPPLRPGLPRRAAPARQVLPGARPRPPHPVTPEQRLPLRGQRLHSEPV